MKRRKERNEPQVLTRPSHRWSYIVLVGVVLLGFFLAITLPNAQPQELRLRVSCLSGARVVGVWVEAERGGSGWAESTGENGDDKDAYRYRLEFGGEFHANIGCGGNSGDWKISAQSGSKANTQRTLECDDLAPGPVWRCRDTS